MQWVYGHDQDAAFDLLRWRSQAGNGKLRRLAEAVIENFRDAKWTTELLGADVKGRYADLKQGSADRCPRLLGTIVKAPEVQYHHEVYNQYLWNKF